MHPVKERGMLIGTGEKMAFRRKWARRGRRKRATPWIGGGSGHGTAGECCAPHEVLLNTGKYLKVSWSIHQSKMHESMEVCMFLPY